MEIRTLSELYAIYNLPKQEILDQVYHELSPIFTEIIEKCPLIFISTLFDVSPRGGEPGFIKVLDNNHLVFGDLPGNNKLDCLRGIIESANIGLCFLLPGQNYFLRIRGLAEITMDEDLVNLCKERKKIPKVVIKVKINDVFYHCGKAILRSNIWNADQWPNDIPTLGQLVAEGKNRKESDAIEREKLKSWSEILY